MHEAHGPSADFDSHHIEGMARAAMERGVPARFSVPLISQIDETLWMGGCLPAVELPSTFRFVVSLYPWESYTVGPDTAVLEVEMYDAAAFDRAAAHRIARFVNAFRSSGPTLVHCQAGLNRSGMVSALALILAGAKPTDAIALLREKRCELVLCNESFEKWLLEGAPL